MEVVPRGSDVEAVDEEREFAICHGTANDILLCFGFSGWGWAAWACRGRGLGSWTWLVTRTGDCGALLGLLLYYGVIAQ